MAKTPAPTVSRVLSTEPAPSVPYTQLNALSPDLSSFIRKLMVYLKDLTYQFGLLQRVNQISGPVTSSGGSQKIYYFVTPDFADDHSSDPDDPAIGNIALFNSGASFPSGRYIIGYDSGAVSVGGGTGGVVPPGTSMAVQDSGVRYRVVFAPFWTMSGGPGTDIGNLGEDLHSNLWQDWKVAAPVPGSTNTDQTIVEEFFSGTQIVINHSGGPIGMYLYDTPRTDNGILSPGSAPRFYLTTFFN